MTMRANLYHIGRSVRDAGALATQTGATLIPGFSPSGKLTGGAMSLAALNGATSSGLILGAGLSGTNYAMGATADNALEFYLDSTHTTGDARGMYLRLYFSGAGGSGEALRAFATVNGVSVATGGTVNGAHISLSLSGAAAAISGAGNALRATLGIGTGVTAPGGTQSVIQVDSDIASAVTPAPGTAFLRFTNSGAVALSYLIRTPTVASAGILAAHTTQGLTHSIRMISEAGTVYYLMVTDAATNRTGGA